MYVFIYFFRELTNRLETISNLRSLGPSAQLIWMSFLKPAWMKGLRWKMRGNLAAVFSSILAGAVPYLGPQEKVCSGEGGSLSHFPSLRSPLCLISSLPSSIPFLCLWRRKASSQVSNGGQVGTQSLYLYLQQMEGPQEGQEHAWRLGWGSGHSGHADLWLLYSCIILNSSQNDLRECLLDSTKWEPSIGMSVQFSSVQSLSRVRLFVTQWTAARQASLSITNSRSLPKLMSIESVMPSNHLSLCHPLRILPSIFPIIRVFFQ